MDPQAPGSFDPDNLNNYEYAQNDPINNIDPGNGAGPTQPPLPGLDELQRVRDWLQQQANATTCSSVISGCGLVNTGIGAYKGLQVGAAALGVGAALDMATALGSEGLLDLLADEAGSIPAAGQTGADAGLGLDSSESWGNPNSLADHFARHGSDFGSGSAEEYANQASQFFQDSQANGFPTKIDSNGVTRVYDPTTNTFGAYNPNGTTRTFFNPAGGASYWQSQPGSSPWIP